MRFEGQQSPRRRGPRSTSDAKNLHYPTGEAVNEKDYSVHSPSNPSTPRAPYHFNTRGGTRHPNNSSRQRDSSVRSRQFESTITCEESREASSRGPVYGHFSVPRDGAIEYQTSNRESPYDQESRDPSFEEDSRDRSQVTRDHLNDRRRRDVLSQSISPRNSRKDCRQVNWQEGRYDIESSVGTDSRTQSSSSETGSSYTTSSSEDDFALNANCMNTLFNKDGPASNLIRCSKTGPNGEVQLKMTLPLPHQLMKGLEDFVPTKREIQTAMEHIRVNGDKLAKTCNFDYSNQHFHEQVLDDDITGRIRPEFYNSLFESQTDMTSTVGDELALQSVMLGTDKREPQSAFSLNPTRLHSSDMQRIESNYGKLGVPRPQSLPSQIELSGNSSYMSSQDSFGFISSTIKSHHPSNVAHTDHQTIHARKGGNGGLIQSNIRDSMENRILEQAPLNSSRFDTSARKAQIPNYDYDAPSNEPSFDEGHVSSAKLRMKNQNLRKAAQSVKNTSTRFSNPDEKQGKDWIHAEREQLDLVDPNYPRADCQEENVLVKSETQWALSRKGMLNAGGIPSFVRCSHEPNDCELKTVCSDLTVDEEAFAIDETVVVSPVSLSDQSVRTRTKSSDIPMKVVSPKRTFRVTQDHDLAPTMSSDELMGPAKPLYISTINSDELMSPLSARLIASAASREEHRKTEVTQLSTAWSTEDAPMDEVMDPAERQPRHRTSSDVDIDELGSLKTKLQRDKSTSHEQAAIDEVITPVKFFNPLADTYASAGAGAGAGAGRLISTPVSTENTGDKGLRSTDANVTMTNATTAASNVSPPMTSADTWNDHAASLEAPMDEPGYMNPTPTIQTCTPVDTLRVNGSRLASHDSMDLLDEGLGELTDKGVSSASSDKSQATVPTENKNHLEEIGPPSVEKSVSAIVKLQPIDFAARLKVVAAARLESMNDLRVVQKPSSTLTCIEPLSQKTGSNFPASTSDRCFDANAKQHDDRLGPTESNPVNETSRHCDDEEIACDNEGRLASEIDARSQAVEVNYIGYRTNRFQDSQSFTTEPALAIAPTSTTCDGSQTVTTVETPLRPPPGETLDTYDRTAWSGTSGSHFTKGVQSTNNFYNFDEEDEESYGKEEEEYQFDERIAKLSSLLPASTRNKKRIVVVAPFSLPSFFLNVFTALWILIGAWTKELLGFKVSKKTKSSVVTKAEPNFREFQLVGDIQPTTCTKIQGSGHRGIGGGYHNEDDAGTVVHYVVPDVHGSGEVEPNRQIWSVSSSSHSTHRRKWHSPKMAKTYSSIRQSFSRSDAKSVASTKDWSAASSLGHSGFVEE